MVTWDYYLWDKDQQLDMEVVRQFEELYGIVYPPEYISILKQNQGKSPTPYVIDVGENKTVVNCLLHFMRERGHKRRAHPTWLKTAEITTR